MDRINCSVLKVHLHTVSPCFLNVLTWLSNVFLETSRLISVSLKRYYVDLHGSLSYKNKAWCILILPLNFNWGFSFFKAQWAYAVFLFHQHVSCILKIVALFSDSVLGKHFSESLVWRNFMSHLKGKRKGRKGKVLSLLKAAGNSYCILKGLPHCLALLSSKKEKLPWNFYFPLEKEVKYHSLFVP